jgi:hypothetical protein
MFVCWRPHVSRTAALALSLLLSANRANAQRDHPAMAPAADDPVAVPDDGERTRTINVAGRLDAPRRLDNALE